MEVNTILAIIAVLISIASLNHSLRQAKTTRRVEIESMLHNAWDLIGGKPGSDTVTDFSSEEDLVLATRNVEKAIMLDPKHPKSHYVMAVIFEALDKPDFAENKYCKVLSLSKHNFFHATHNLGRIMSNSGRSEEAIKLYKKSLKNSNEKSELYFNLGFTSLSIGNVDEAIKYFEESISVDKTKSKSYANLIAVLGMNDGVDRAEYYLRMAAENMADDIDVCRNASTLYQMTGEKDKFDYYFNKYKRLDETGSTNKSSKKDVVNRTSS